MACRPRCQASGPFLDALRLEETGYHAYHVIGSRAARDRFDIDRTERELGFRCEVEFAEYE